MNIYRLTDADQQKIRTTFPLSAILADVACKQEDSGTWQMVFSHHVADMLKMNHGIDAKYVAGFLQFEPLPVPAEGGGA